MKNTIRVFLFSIIAVTLVTSNSFSVTSVAHAATCAASAALSEGVSNATPHVGDIIAYTLSGGLGGNPSVPTQILVNDSLGAGLTFVSASPSVGTYTSSTGTWDLGTFSGTFSVSGLSLVINAKVNAGTEGQTIGNTPSVSQVPNCTDSSAVTGVSITIQGSPTATSTVQNADLSVVKSVDNAAPKQGDTVHYTVTASALGPATSTGVTATDTLPIGLTFVSATTSLGSYASSTGSWVLGDMSAGSTATLQIAARVNASSGTAITNIATASESASSTDTNPANNTASTTITVAAFPLADLAIAKTADVTSTVPGNTVHYTITVSALGPASSTGVVATDTLPSGLTFANATASVGTYASSTGTWTIGNLAASSTATLNLAATVNAGTAGTTIVNTAVAGESSSTIDNNLGNNSSTVSITVQSGGGGTPSTTLAILPPTLPNGTVAIPYAVTLNATGTAIGPFTWSVASGTLPTGLRLATSTTATTTISGTPTATGTFPFVISVTNGSTTATQAYTVTIGTLPQADISVVKTVDSIAPLPSSTIHYTIIVSALGPATSTGVTATDTLPLGLVFLNATTSIGSYSSSTGSWTIGDLSASSTATLQIAAQVNAISGTTITNTATVGESASSTDSNPANNTASTTLVVGPVGGGGGPVTGTLNVIVTGLQNGATSTVTVTDVTLATSTATTTGNATIPFVLKVNDTFAVTATTTSIGYAVATGTNCGGNFAGNATCTVTFTLATSSPTLAILPPTLPNGTVSVPYAQALTATGTAVGPFAWTVSSGTLPTSLVLGTSTASTTQISGTPTATGTFPFVISVTNGSTTATQAYTVTIGTLPQADIGVVKTVDNAAPHEGDVIHYTVTALALGPATSTGVTVQDNLPPGLTFISATTSAGTYVATSGVWTVGNMSPNTTSTLVISSMVNAGTAAQTIVNHAVVSESSTVIDQNLSNNSSSVTLIVLTNGGGGGPPSADLALVKTVDNAAPHEGNTINYTVTVSALGPATSTGVTATDTLPVGLTFVSATASKGSYASSTGSWAIGDMSATSTATLVITATVNSGTAGQTITNTAVGSESIAVSDPNTTNNTASVPLTVAQNTSVCTVNCGGGGGGPVVSVGGGGGTFSVGGGGSAYEIAIDDGAPTTATTSATLSLFGTGAYTMELSNSTDFSSSTWIPYVTTMPWTLTSGDGLKTVYVNYRNVRNQQVGSANDSIQLVTGQVLGAATSAVGSGTSCGLYLYKYIRLGGKNDPVEVKKLQTFLNQNLGAHLPVTGYYGLLTYAAVQQFQVKYSTGVLAPWIPYGLPSAMDPTGYVFKTTRRWINNLVCPPLNLPLPDLSSNAI